MGIENMRRWPMYILFALCILLFLSLFNSWSLEGEMRLRISELSSQLQECSKQQSSCVSDSLVLMEQRNTYMEKVQNLDNSKVKLSDDIVMAKTRLKKAEGQVNTTQVELQMCTTELQSFKNLQITMTATIETLRLENSQLVEKKQKIVELQKEIEKLKTALTTKAAPVPPLKITPAAQPMKQSPALDGNNLMEKPAVETNKLADQPPLESNNAVEHPALDSNDPADHPGVDNNIAIEDNNANEELDTNLNDQDVDPQFQ